MQINTNLAANNAYRNLNNTQNDLSKSLEKLSSGLRINRASDDAAGLALSEGLRSQVGGLTVAARNAQDGIGVVQTAEGGLNEVHSILQRMRDLAVQAGNDSNNTDSRAAITTEATALTSELTRIAGSTDFNGAKLLNGTAGSASDGKMSFQVGANTGDQIVVDLASANVSNVVTAMGTLDFSTATGAASAIGSIDTAIKSVSSARSELGAVQNRFEHTIKNINVSKENLSASESRIRDTDMAEEMVKYTKNNILSQAGTAMLAQANQSSQGVLQLLR
ncbi:flagellin [Pseudarthrobacter sp. AG30]|nr:flagellin [Pseudarthrobacter sp. AG30]